MNKTKFFLSIGVILFLLISIIGLKYDYKYGEDVKEIKKVDCYDKYSNKIEGVICEDIKTDSTGLIIFSIAIILSMFLFMLHTIVILFEPIGTEHSNWFGFYRRKKR